MAYVPPHRRLSLHAPPRPASPSYPHTTTPHPSPSSSSSSSSASSSNRFLDHRRHTTFPQYHFDICWATRAIRRFLVLLDTDSPADDDTLLEFAPFYGETFPHLQNEAIYTLRLATVSAGADPFSCQQLKLDRLDINEEQTPQALPQLSIVASLREDLYSAVTQVKDYLHDHTANETRSSLTLRFGRVLFHCSANNSLDRTSLERHGKSSPRTLEKAWADRSLGRYVRKTFDNCVPHDFFNNMKQIAVKEAWKPAAKERYLVQVEDEERPNFLLYCTCCVGTDGRSGNSFSLILKKVKASPYRHMVADMACVGKKSDLRLIVTTTEHLIDLPTEEKQALENIISRASIDTNVKGGLHWPLSLMDSSKGRYKVVGAWHVKKRLFEGSSTKWLFRHANRVDFKTSSGRVSYEVEVKLKIWKDYVKGKREWDQDEILSSVKDLVKWTWQKCL